MSIVDGKVFRFYLKECSLHIHVQLIVSFNFGFDHGFNCPNEPLIIIDHRSITSIKVIAFNIIKGGGGGVKFITEGGRMKFLTE